MDIQVLKIGFIISSQTSDDANVATENIVA